MRRRATDGLSEQRMRYPSDELWELSCRLDDGRPRSPVGPGHRRRGR